MIPMPHTPVFTVTREESREAAKPLEPAGSPCDGQGHAVGQSPPDPPVPSPGTIPELPTRGSSCSWDMEPGQQHQASEQIGGAPLQPTNPRGGHWWEERQGSSSGASWGAVQRKGSPSSEMPG